MSQVKKEINKEAKAPRYFSIQDEDGKELIRHSFAALYLIATPDMEEAGKLLQIEKNKEGKVPLICYQFGIPPAVLALLQATLNVIPQIRAKWVNRLKAMEEAEKEKIITATKVPN